MAPEERKIQDNEVWKHLSALILQELPEIKDGISIFIKESLIIAVSYTSDITKEGPTTRKLNEQLKILIELRQTLSGTEIREKHLLDATTQLYLLTLYPEASAPYLRAALGVLSLKTRYKDNSAAE